MLPLDIEQRFVRYPTKQEITELKACVAESMTDHVTAGDRETASELVDTACVAVFPNYVSDVPGYCGRVLFAVFGGGPYTRAAFTWNEEGRMVLVSECDSGKDAVGGGQIDSAIHGAEH